MKNSLTKKISDSIGILALLLCTLVGATNSRADDLITNGGFETGDFSGWTLSGAATSSAFPSAFYGVDAADAATGSYGAYLGSEFSTLTLSQTFPVQQANYYTVSFSLAQNSAVLPGFNNSFLVSFNGVPLFSETNAPVSAFTNYSFTTSTAAIGTGSALLQLTSQNDPGYFSLDDVSVSTGTATPEPATLLLIAPALAIMAWKRRKASIKKAAHSKRCRRPYQMV